MLETPVSETPAPSTFAERRVFHRILVGLRGDQSDRSLIEYSSMLLGPADPPASRRLIHVMQRHEKQPDLPAECLVLNGAGREDELLHAALDYEADLLVLGVRRESRSRKLVRRMAMKAPCSILLVPEGYPRRIRRILAAVDFSLLSADALQLAVTLARENRHTSLDALHVYFETAAVSYEGHDAVLRRRELDGFGGFLSPLNLEGIKVEQLLEDSSSVSHAVQAAVASRGIDLVVMGTRGRSASASVLLGSQTEQCIQETTVPLLAVKHFGANLGLLEVLLDRSLRDTPRFG